MILYFVRHGQTDFNKQHLLQGTKLDEPLNDDGIKQMEELSKNLPHDFEVIITSPLKRTSMSAEIIKNAFGKPIINKNEISERDFGSLAGKTWDDIPGGRTLQQIDRKLEYDYRPFGGESVEDVSNRIKTFLKDTKNSNYKIVLVVSSIGIIRLMYKLLLNKNITEVENATVHTFEI